MASQASDDYMGCVLILSNPYREKWPKLHEQHSRLMEKLWTEKLGCELFEKKVHTDLTAQEVMDVFGRLATKDGSIYQYLIVVVIGNGGLLPIRDKSLQPFIEAKDGNFVQEEKFFSKFYNNNQAWCEKPKLFVLAYNRIGDMKPRNLGDIPREQFLRKPKNKAISGDGNRADKTCSKFSGLLTTYGSATHLIQTVYDVFSTRYTTDTFTQMLTKVNKKMKKQDKRIVFESTITSPCTFFPSRNKDIRNDLVSSSSPVNDHLGRAVETLTECLKRSSSNRKVAQSVKDFLSTFDQNSRIVEAQDAISQLPKVRKTGKTPSKGYAVVISNSLEKGSTCHEKDEETMKNLWKDELRCEIETHLDRTAVEMEKILEKLAASDSSGYDYLVVTVSSHGGLEKMDTRSNISQKDGGILQAVCQGVDGQLVSERRILGYFEDKESPWHDKVKLFIFDYCRGEKKEVRVPKAGTSYPDYDYDCDEYLFYPGTLPLMNKCVVVYATYYDHLAWPNDLIPTLADVFEDNWDHKSLTEMLVMVNARMKDMEPGKVIKAMSIFKSTLGDEFYLYREKEIENEDIQE